ncbi:MAG: hypothetical protein KGJ89_04615 [Patescibacteria group bacterium]|nr:hypothetical protein [Patescibacteria group bacterium]MDE2015835.1 hypothetical protein [Patescibacteria group bacterium]MDE2227210.1 hypothetical protein [Patescibacteria group bacterium]
MINDIKNKILRQRGGYIALLSALIISAVVVVIILTLGQGTYLHRINIANSYFKERSRALAGACVETGLLDLTSNPNYSGNETINVASDTCRIVSVVSGGTGRVISAQGIFQNSYTNYKVTVATSTVSILGWEEVQNF